MSEYSDGRPKTVPSPQMYDINKQPIYDAPDTIDWAQRHKEPEPDKPSLNPSPELAVQPPVISPSDFEKAAIGDMVSRSPSLKMLTPERLEQLRLMGKPEPVPAVESPIIIQMAQELAELESRQRFEDAEVDNDTILG